MTYLEAYRSMPTIEDIKAEALKDAKIAMLFGNNPDRIKEIEDAMNKAIAERSE